MAMKKKMESQAGVVIAGGAPGMLFPPGFRYRVGSDIYTVKRGYIEDNAEWRELVTLDGVIEHLTVASIAKDLYQQPANVDAEILNNPGQNKLDPEKK
jgi:hypothetical protein